MRTILILFIALTIGCAATPPVSVTESTDGRTWTVNNPPNKGSVKFEKSKDATSIEVEDKGSANPFRGLRRLVSNTFAIVLQKTDVQIPID